MRRTGGADLVGRLAPHAPSRFATPPGMSWPGLGTAGRRGSAATGRDRARLATLLDRWILLVVRGWTAGDALLAVGASALPGPGAGAASAVGRGAASPLLDGLATACARLRGGADLSAAVAAWAVAARDPELRRLAADLSGYRDVAATIVVLDRHAGGLRREARRAALRRLRLRCTAVWVAGAVTAAASVALLAT